MSGRDFGEEIKKLLGENSAVEDLSRGNVTVGSRAGKTKKDEVLVKPLSNNYDVTYHGCNNGWEKYTIHNETPAEVPEEEDEIRELADKYRQDATDSRRHTPTFGEWMSKEQT